jgi:hypothetical protein
MLLLFSLVCHRRCIFSPPLLIFPHQKLAAASDKQANAMDAAEVT